MAENLGNANLELRVDLEKFSNELKTALSMVKQTMVEMKNGLNINVDNVNFAPIKDGLKGVDEAAKDTSKSVEGIDAASGKVITGFAKMEVMRGVLDGVKQAFGELKNYVMNLGNEYADTELVQEKLRMGLERIGAGDYFSKLKQQADELHKITPFDDQDITNMQSILTTFDGISGAAIQNLTPSILNLASAFARAGDTGMDLQQIAIMIGKSGAAEMAGALQRVGIVMSETQKEMWGTMTAAQRFDEMQKILAANSSITAEAFGKTLAGQIKIAENAFGDIKEAIGKAFAPMIIEVSNAIVGLSQLFQKLPEGIQATIGVVVGLGVATLALLPVLTALNIELGGIPIIIGSIVAVGVGLGVLGASANVTKKSVLDLSGELTSTRNILGELNIIAEYYDAVTIGNTISSTDFKNSLQAVAQQYPGIISGVDEETGAQKVNLQVLNDLIEAKKEEIRVKERAIQIQQTEELGKNIEVYTDAQKDYNKLVSEEIDLKSELIEFNQRNYSNSEKGEQQKAYDLNVVNKKHDEVIQKLAVSTDGADKLRNSFRDMIITALKVGNVETEIQRLKNSTINNVDATNLLKSAFQNFASPAIMSLLGLDSAMKKSADLSKLFYEALQLAQAGNFEAAFKKYQEVMEKAKTVPTTITPPGAGPKGNTGDSGKSKEDDDILKSVTADYDHRLRIMDDEVKLGQKSVQQQKELLGLYQAALENITGSLTKTEDRNKAEEKISDLKIKQADIDKKNSEELKKYDKDRNTIISDVETFVEKRKMKVLEGIAKEVSEIENSYRLMQDRVSQSGISEDDKVFLNEKLNFDKTMELNNLKIQNEKNALDELRQMKNKNIEDEYAMGVDAVNKKYDKEKERIQKTYIEGTSRSNMLKELEIARVKELETIQTDSGKRVTALLQAGFQGVQSIIGNGFNEMWNDVFGEANSLFEMFIKSVIQKLTEIAASAFFVMILRAIGVYGGGGASAAFATGGYTGDGNPTDIAGAVHYKEFVINEEGLSVPGNRGFAELMNQGKSIGDMIRNMIPKQVSYDMPSYDFSPSTSGGSKIINVNIGDVNTSVHKLTGLGEKDWIDVVDEVIPKIADGLHRIGKEVLDKSLKNN